MPVLSQILPLATLPLLGEAIEFQSAARTRGFGGRLALDFGKLLLPPTGLGSIPRSGNLVVPLAVGSVPATIGLELFCQCGRLGASPSFTNLLVIPITP